MEEKTVSQSPPGIPGRLPPLLVSRREAAGMLGISPVLLWRATNAGDLASVRIGGRRLYALEDLIGYVARCRAAADQKKGDVP